MTNANPTPSANYTALVAYIISVVPEIMELKMGCRVKGCHGYHVLREKYTQTKDDLYETLDGRFLMQIREIIGRPITLQDVLIAAFVGKIDLGIKVTNKTTVRLMHVTATMMSTKTGWLLSNPLSGQDKDTIDWLKSLFPIAK